MMEIILAEQNRKKETAAPFDVYGKEDVYLIL